MKEVLYAAEKNFLERYLKEKASASIEDMTVVAGLWADPISGPGSDKAVGEIYRVDGDTAHIKIEGVLSPEGPDAWDLFFGYNGVSYKTIQAAIEKAKTDHAIARVIFDINSPGGTISQCDETWMAHKALASVKPTEVHAEFLASAAYWISTPAGKILATTPTSEIGSVGVLVATYDWSKYEEKIGIKEIVITSSNAPDKYPDVSTKHGRDTIKSQLDAMERIFYSRITECRGVTTEHIAERFGKGGLLVAADPDLEKDDAVSVGMIDGMVNGDYIAGKPFPGSKSTEAEKKEIAANIERAMKPGAKFYDRDGNELSPEENEKTRQSLISMVNSPLNGKNTPATAGIGGSAMTLQEFMAQNPAAKVEVDALTAKVREEAKAEYSARVDKVLPIIQSAAYPANIKTIACNVLAGKEEMAAFTATVAVFDAQLEAGKSLAAQEEAKENGSVTAEAPNLEGGEKKAVDSAWTSSIADAKARQEKARQEVA
ncbi:MAG: S49 family peptidase [Treponema sp.]|jgi:ClpP class serine protease|nr:S49 family peptidase [Treponema sp.]